MKTSQLLRMVAGIGYGIMFQKFLPIVAGLSIFIASPILYLGKIDVADYLTFIYPYLIGAQIAPFVGLAWFAKKYKTDFPYFFAAASATSAGLYLFR